MSPVEPLMTTQEVADYLGVPVNTLYRWRTEGEGPRAIKVGRHLRFRRLDVEMWLEAHVSEQGADR